MAYGADEVPVRAAELAGIDRPDSPDPRATEVPETANDGVLYFPTSSAVCGPGGGGGGPASTTVWTGTAAYRVGAFHIGVRYNDPETAACSTGSTRHAGPRTPGLPSNSPLALYPGAQRRFPPAEPARAQREPARPEPVGRPGPSLPC